MAIYIFAKFKFFIPEFSPLLGEGGDDSLGDNGGGSFYGALCFTQALNENVDSFTQALNKKITLFTQGLNEKLNFRKILDKILDKIIDKIFEFCSIKILDIFCLH